MIDNLISLTENKACELIKCPECGSIQRAIVKRKIPFNIYIHVCICGFVIMESEWIPVNKNFLENFKTSNPLSRTWKNKTIIKRGNWGSSQRTLKW